MEPLLAPWHALVCLNTRLLRNCLDRVDDALAPRRPAPRVNPMGFVALHVLDARHVMGDLLGVKVARPFSGLLDRITRVEDLEEYPNVSAVLEAWGAISASVEQALVDAAPAVVLAPAALPYVLPIDDKTVLGSLAFLLQHESYHIGQLALARRLLGLGPMSYS